MNSADMFFDNSPEKILAYLQEQLPDYPYRPELDAAFIAELTADFPDVDILEEIKTFRWYFDNAPLSRVNNVRVPSVPIMVRHFFPAKLE